MHPMKICVLGAGAWGTALAISAAGAPRASRCGRATPPRPQAMRAARENQRYLPGIPLPDVAGRAQRCGRSAPRATRNW